MAWVFSLSAECGTEQSQAEQFAEHFRDIIWTIDNGIEAQCQADIAILIDFLRKMILMDLRKIKFGTVIEQFK